MSPNRKNGMEVDLYFREHYEYQPLDSSEFRDIVAAEILNNEYKRNKLSEGVVPDIQSYIVDDVFIGIDVNSGEFHIESVDIDKVKLLYDDLFVFRGLDKDDLNNYFLVAEYVKLSER